MPLLNGKDTESVVKAFEEELKKYPKELVLSMTHDRGKEMTKHETLTQNLGIKIYFCDPHSPYHWR